jgi:glycoprotein endo-alpha-1,2-mannosidase
MILNDEYQRDVHVFYYIWWQNAHSVDGKWLHWNHDVLPHWTPAVNSKYPQIGKRHDPEKEHIASNFWPLRGPYSSGERSTVRAHFESMAQHGIGTVVVSWWGRKEIAGPGTDEGGLASDKAFDDMVPMLLEEAQRLGLKICFHLEPYKGRTAVSTLKDVRYLID